MLDRVGDQILDDALDLRSIDIGDHGIHGDGDRMTRRGRDAYHEQPDVRGLPHRPHESVAKAVDVQQIGEQPLEAHRLADDLVGQVALRRLVDRARALS